MKYQKNIIFLIVSIWFGQISCVHSEQPSVPSDTVLETKKPIAVSELPQKYRIPYAEFVSEETIKVFPHLQHYKGYGLLGNREFHLVLKPVSSEPEVSELKFAQKLFVFSLGRWTDQSQLGRLSIGFKIGSSNLPVALTAINPTIFSDRKAAQAELMIKVAGAKHQPKVYLNVSDKGAGFYLTVDAKPLATSAQTRGLLSVSLNIEKDGGATTADRFSAMFFGGENFISVVSESEVQVTKLSDRLSVSRQVFKETPWNGLKVSLGTTAATRHLLDTSALQKCASFKLTGSALDKTKSLDECLNNSPRGTMVIDLKSSEDNPKHLNNRKFAVYRHGSKIPVSFFSVVGGRSVPVWLPVDESFYITDLVTGETWGNKTPVRLGDSAVETIQLNSRELVEAVIGSDVNQSSAFLDIRSAQPELGQINLNRSVVFLSEGIQVNDDWFAVKSWPLKFRVHPGAYTLKFFVGGYSDIVCETTITITSDKKNEFKCPFVEAKKILPDTLNVFSSLSSTKPVHPQRYFNRSLGISLWVLPSNSVNEKINHSVFQTGSKDISLFDQVEAVRKLDPDAFIELDCPEEYISKSSYLDLVKKVKPDALRLYNCDRSDELQQYLSSRWKPKTDGAFPLITPVADYSEAAPYYLSKMSFDRSIMIFKEYFAELKSGNFDVFSGVELAMSEIQRKRGSKLDQISLKLNLRQHEGVHAHTIKVYGLGGFIYKKNLVLNKGPEHQVKLRFSMPAKNRFARVEVWGKSGRSTERHPSILGATRFVDLSEGNK